MTTSKNKARGSKWERDTVAFLQANGFTRAQRSYSTGQHKDVGDVLGIPSLTIECKDLARFSVWDLLDETRVERDNSMKPYGICVLKRRGSSAGEAAVLLSFSEFVQILKEIQ